MFQLVRSQRFHWIDCSGAASGQIACQRSRCGQDDRYCDERQGIERADAEQERFHESHKCGCRAEAEADDDSDSSQGEVTANEHPAQRSFFVRRARGGFRFRACAAKRRTR